MYNITTKMIKFFLTIFSIVYTVTANDYKCWRHDTLKHYFIKINGLNWIEIEYLEESFTLMNHLEEYLYEKKDSNNEVILLRYDTTYFKFAFYESFSRDSSTSIYMPYLNGSWTTDIEYKLILNQINADGNFNSDFF